MPRESTRYSTGFEPVTLRDYSYALPTELTSNFNGGFLYTFLIPQKGLQIVMIV